MGADTLAQPQLTRLRARASLQARLLALVLGVLALVWLSAAAFTWRDARDELDELLDGHLAQSAALLIVQQVGHGADRPDGPEGSDGRPEIAVGPTGPIAPAARTQPARNDRVDDAPSLHKYAPKVAFQVFHENRLTLRSANAGVQPMAPKTRGFSTVSGPNGQNWRVFAAQGGEGDVQVYVGEQVASRDSILWAVLKGIFMPLLWALPLIGLGGWLAIRGGLRPLRTLSDELARRRPQDLDPLALSGAPSELQPMLAALNALFVRIAAMIEAERRFTADAAHELRTPIAAIRMQAQVALGAADGAERERALQQTLQGCDRATHLVEQLLTLSRLEDAAQAPPGTHFELGAVAQRVAAELALTALQRGQDLSLEVAGPAPLQANEVLTGVLLRNLIDNALRYSPDGAQVRVRVDVQGAIIVLRVEDSGQGLTDEQIAHLGERFYRVLGTQKTGSGLGWSIVRRIAQVSAAQIEVQRSADLGGLAACVRWPVGQPD